MEFPDSASAAVARYEAIATRLPAAQFPKASEYRQNLFELVDDIDCFVLDGFGVLNVGDVAVPEAAVRIKQLRDVGKTLRVLTNGASYPSVNTAAKYQKWGMDFSVDEVVSSRDALATALMQHPSAVWGFAAWPDSEIARLASHSLLLENDAKAYAACDGFVLLGSGAWTLERQALLATALETRPRPVFIGNPDLVAPHPTGLSHEPGLYAHALIDSGHKNVSFYGKPFDNAFAEVRKTLGEFAPSRCAMVGDTLHTDILGGAQCGWRTVLVTGHGILKGQDVEAAISRSGIRPDFIVPTT